MSSKLDKHVANQGDIDVYASDKYVQVTVDGSTVLFFDKKNAEQLAKTLMEASQ